LTFARTKLMGRRCQAGTLASSRSRSYEERI